MSSYSSTTTLQQAVDYNLSTLVLLSPSFGKIDLKKYMVELSYFEDIYSNSVTGKLVISDAVGVVLLTSLRGTELLQMEFTKGTGGTPITKTFSIFSVSDRQIDIGNNFETYVINFCTDDLMLSERYRISKSYKAKLISDMITDILDNILQTGTSFSVEPTKGIYDFVLPNKKIFETINWLASYALPVAGKSGADMIFFENANGYQFKSLQTLYKQSPRYSYYYNPKNILTDSYKTNLQPDNIYRLQLLNSFDTFDAVMKGTFASRVVTIDPLRRKRTVTDFNYNQYKSSASSLNNSKYNPLFNPNYKDRFKKSLYESPPNNLNSGALRYMISNSGQTQEGYVNQNDIDGVSKDYSVETYLTNRVSQLALTNYTKLKIIIPGNSDVIAGSVLNINIFDIKAISNERVEDSILSGNYLVTAVRHLVTPNGYTSVVELAKDSNIG